MCLYIFFHSSFLHAPASVSMKSVLHKSIFIQKFFIFFLGHSNLITGSYKGQSSDRLIEPFSLKFSAYLDVEAFDMILTVNFLKSSSIIFSLTN